MRFTLEYPVSAAYYHPDLISADGLKAVASAAENAGVHSIAFTEHPAPSTKWMDSGGHHTLDPLTALAFCAAATTTIKVMPYALVLPYYHPLMLAKQLATLDRLSSGRLEVVVAAGYLRSEFLALGSDLQDRNRRFDETLEVMAKAWRESPCSFETSLFRGRNVIQAPSPFRVPPILVGGNSRAARARAAAHDGWSPLLISKETSQSIRTARLDTTALLAEGIREVRDLAGERGPSLTVQVESNHNKFLENGFTIAEHVDHLAALEEAGVNNFVIKIPSDSIESACEYLHFYGETFIKRVG